jgi:hypothetical protein
MDADPAPVRLQDFLLAFSEPLRVWRFAFRPRTRRRPRPRIRASGSDGQLNESVPINKIIAAAFLYVIFDRLVLGLISFPLQDES